MDCTLLIDVKHLLLMEWTMSTFRSGRYQSLKEGN